MIARSCVQRGQRPSKPKSFCGNGAVFEGADWPPRNRTVVPGATGAIFWHSPAAISDAQQLPPRRQAAPQPEPGRQQRRAAGTQRPRARHVGSPTVALLNERQPVSKGWSTSFRMGVSKKGLNDLDRGMSRRAQRSMKRRHPMQSGGWRTEQYWGRTCGRQGPRGLAGEKAPWDAEAVRLDQDRSPAAGADALFPRCPAPTGLRAPETRPVSGDRVSSPTARPEAARHLPGLSPAPGKWRGTPYPSGGPKKAGAKTT